MSQLSGEQMLFSLILLGFLRTAEPERFGIIHTGRVEKMDSAGVFLDGPSLLSLNLMAFLLES